MPKRIIIDTDPGIDDAVAIFLALQSPELEIVGLTTIFGNVDTDLATQNALRLLEIADRIGIPVAKGAEHPLAGPYIGPADVVHGADGQGNIHLSIPSIDPILESAAEFIIEQVMTFPGQITLVPIGPLTNIALALHLEPELAQNVKEVVLMGGNAFVPGNATPAAEANIWHDPEAADVVLGAGWPITMVGLDVTHKVIMTGEQLTQYKRAKNPLARHIAKIMPFYQHFIEKTYGIDGIHVHDSTAIAYLIDPSAFETRQYPLRVETQGISRGKTWPAIHSSDKVNPWHNRPLVNVCVGVDAARTTALEFNRLTISTEDDDE